MSSRLSPLSLPVEALGQLFPALPCLRAPGSPRSSPLSECRVTHGPNDSYFEIGGKTIASIRRSLRTPFNLPDDTKALVNGVEVDFHYRLRPGDWLEFVKRRGWKGVDDAPVPDACRLLTVKEAAAELYCSSSFVYKLMRTGQLAFERRGRRKLPLAISVAEYRLRNTCPATNQPFRPSRSPEPPYKYQRLFRDKRFGPDK